MKIAILGCGNIALNHLKYIFALEKDATVALCDRNVIRLEYFSKRFDIKETYTDLELMLDEFKPDAVHVLTPPGTHKQLAMICLERGCHMFIEKPLCMTGQEAKELIEVSRRNSCVISTDYIRLKDPLIEQVDGLLESGKYGQVRSVTTYEVDTYLDRKASGFAPPWMSSLPGEIISDLLPHHLSVILKYATGVSLQSMNLTSNENGAYTRFHGLFSGDGGFSASVSLNIDTYPKRNEVMLECENGTIEVDFRNSLVIERPKVSGPQLVDRVLGGLFVSLRKVRGSLAFVFNVLRGRYDSYEGMERMVAAFYSAIRKEEPLPFTDKQELSLVELYEKVFSNMEAPEAKDASFESTGVREKVDALVTGGLGFIGKRLVRSLLEHGISVRVLVHRELKPGEREWFPEGDLEFVRGDITNLEDLVKACRGAETVYHLAAATRGSLFAHLDISALGTKNIIEAARQCGVEHIVYTSSIGVLNSTGYPNGKLIDEDFPYEKNPDKRGSYSHAKMLAEKIALENSDKIPITVLRPGLVYGEGKGLLILIGKTVGKRLLLVLGRKRSVLPLVYHENLVDAFLLAGQKRVPGIYNVIDHDRITVGRFIKDYKRLKGDGFISLYLASEPFLTFVKIAAFILDKLMGLENSIGYGISAVRRRAIHSTSRIEKALGWKQKIPYETAFKRTVEHEQK